MSDIRECVYEHPITQYNTYCKFGHTVYQTGQSNNTYDYVDRTTKTVAIPLELARKVVDILSLTPLDASSRQLWQEMFDLVSRA
jgi:hypothetical protein